MNRKQVGFLISVGVCVWVIGSLVYAFYFQKTLVSALEDIAFVGVVTVGLVIVIPTIAFFLVLTGYERLADKEKEHSE